MPDNILKLALAQMPVAEDKAKNIAEARERIRNAARQGAELIVLPEMFLCPYSNLHFVQNAEPAGGQAWKAMSECARENQVILVAGTIPEQDGNRLFNTSFVFNERGEQLARHRKMHLFDINVSGGQQFYESATFSPGQEVTVFDTRFGKIGLCVCFDMRFPELARLMALKGAQVILTPAAFNMTTGPAHWELMFRQRAVDNQVFTVGVAPARDEKGVYISYGNSIACSPWGDVLCRADAAETTLLVDMDLDRVRQIRAQLPLINALRHDIYSIVEHNLTQA